MASGVGVICTPEVKTMTLAEIAKSTGHRECVGLLLASDALYQRLGEIVANPRSACAGRDDLLRALAEISPTSTVRPPNQLALSLGAMVFSIVDQWAALIDDTNEIMRWGAARSKLELRVTSNK